MPHMYGMNVKNMLLDLKLIRLRTKEKRCAEFIYRINHLKLVEKLSARELNEIDSRITTVVIAAPPAS